MKVERPRPHGLARGLWWDYQTRHGTPGYYVLPLLVPAVLAFDVAVYSWTQAHPVILLLILVTVLGYGAGLMAWWIGSGHHRTRRLIKIRCGHCPYTAFTTWHDFAERGMRTHLADTHRVEATDHEIGRYIVDHVDEHTTGGDTP